jgi:phage terminase large subunit GpA-like protein
MERISGIFREAAIRGIPNGSLDISTWASRNRYLSPEDSAKPGLYDPNVTPYLIEPQNCISDPRVFEVVLMTSAQIAKTTLLLNAIGYYSDAEPSPILMVMPTEDLCKLFSKKRLRTMIRDSPRLKDCYRPDSEQEVLEKYFDGGFVSLAGTNSPVKLSSQPIRIVLGDELDRMLRDVAGEGSPVALARKRSTSFPNRKHVWTSTPTKKGDSPIEDLYLKSDMRKYFVPCPFCNALQLLLFKNVHIVRESPLDSYFICEQCVKPIDEQWRKDMIKVESGAKWIAEKPFQGRAGFWLNQWYSPFVTIGETVLEFLDTKDKKETLKTTINTVFAETFDDSEEPEIKGVEDQREIYPAEVPNGVLVLVAGMDIQGDRLEIEICGYGLGEESWSIDYHIIEGLKDIIGEKGEATTRKLTPNDHELWDRAKTVLTKAYRHEHGYDLYILAVGIDTGGHHTKKAYEMVKSNRGRNWLAMKGAKDAGKPILSRPTRSNKARIPLFTIGTEAAKDVIYGNLQVKEMGPGYCHFPDNYEKEYFLQLTAEKRTNKFERGKSEIRYVKIKERNEALDCRVLNYCALTFLEPNFTQLSEIANTKNINALTVRHDEDPEPILQPEDDLSDYATGQEHIEPTPAPTQPAQRDLGIEDDDLFVEPEQEYIPKRFGKGRGGFRSNRGKW